MPAHDMPAPLRTARTAHRLLVSGLALTASFALAGCAALPFIPGGRGGQDGPDVTSPSPTASLEEQATQLVQEHMDDLAAGDVDAALEVMQESSGLRPIKLPTEVYSAALETAPVADIVVGTPVLDTGSLPSGDVPVTFTVGGQPATAELMVHDYDGDGTLELITGLSHDLRLPSGAEHLPLTINGIEVEASETGYFVLPGSYTLAVTSEDYAIPEGAEAVVRGHDADDWGDLELSESGAGRFRERIRTEVETCLQDTSVSSTACGFSPLPESSADGWVPTDGTVQRTLSETSRADLEAMEPDVDVSDPTKVSGRSVLVDTTFDCTKGGQRGRCEMLLGGSTGTPRVDFSDPNLPVTWG